MKVVLKILGLGFLLVMFNACGNPYPFVHDYETKVKLGDQREWVLNGFDDSEWQWYDNVEGNGVFWARMKVKLSEDEKFELKDLGMCIIATGGYQAYWDGHHIGDNGRLEMDGQKEIPGKYHCFFRIPDSLIQAGEHLLALRATSMDAQITPHSYVLVGNYNDMITGPLQVTKYMFLIGGAFLITAFYFFFVFVNQPKEYSTLIFAIICLIVFGLIIMEYLKHFYAYEYPFQYTRMVIIGYLHILTMLLIPLFFTIQFSFPWKKILFGLMIVSVVIIEWKYESSFDIRAWNHDKMMWIFSAAVVAYACFEKKKGAYLVLSGLVLSFLLPYLMPYIYIPFVSSRDISFFIGFVLLLLLMFYLMTLKRREERLAYEASLVLSERLKNELLKKNIKPHFIMNTLTSLIDWVEESPKEGVKFINALASEFEVLNQIADYKQIPIGQEIKLCKSHLVVMGYRKEIAYVWTDEGIDPNEIIPPAVIHTAVENGVTHSLPDEQGNITFHLIYEKADSYKQYTLQTIARNRPQQNKEISKVERGTGLKYIKARLQESYGNRWSIKSQETENGWETIVKIWKKEVTNRTD